MFQEGQLYSPVTAGHDGEVTVHLADDHPGANDPDYRARRNEIAAAALKWTPGTPAPRIDYSTEEQTVWRTVCQQLEPKHEKYAIDEYRTRSRTSGSRTTTYPSSPRSPSA
jgi:phenylalanine-4-hydroxylase